ncbi:MAG: hypothetical protein K2Q34_01880, partial [Alphaproteobacteria bacterium]|nr:hypothetical protein [Alphaproteobacteria bacterium]
VATTLGEDTTEARRQLVSRVVWDVLGNREEVHALTVLDGKPGALRKTVVGDYPTAQAAIDEYKAALAKKDTLDDKAGRDAVIEILDKVKALRVGTKKRDVLYLAEKEGRTNRTTADMRLSRDKAKAKSGGGLDAAGLAYIRFHEELLQAIDRGAFNALTELPEAHGVELDDVDLLASEPQSSKLVNLFIAFGKTYTTKVLENASLKNDAAERRKAEAEAEARALAAARAASKPKPTGGHTSDSDEDAMGLFGLDD